MKKIILLASVSLLLASFANAQKYAVIDTKYILDKIPDYKQAQKLLDTQAADWQQEIDRLQQELDRMYKDFEC
jgi:outer membrane protein